MFHFRFKMLVVVLMLCYHIAQASDNNYYFRNYNISNGLSCNIVNDILQDRQGFMWFATSDGLNKFDGTTFKQYKANDFTTEHLGAIDVKKLCQDANDRLWLGTDRGLYIYSPKDEHIEQVKLFNDYGREYQRSVSAIEADLNGNIWIATQADGLFCYTLETDSLVHYSLRRLIDDATHIVSIGFDNRGVMWFGTYNKALYYSDNNLKTVKQYIPPHGSSDGLSGGVVNKILPGKFNTLYIGLESAMKEMSLLTGKLTDIVIKDKKGKQVFCRDLVCTEDNKLWIATESGAYIYDPRTKTHVHCFHNQYDSYSLSDDAIYTLCQDQEGNMWLGSYFGGADYCQLSGDDFRKYYMSDQAKGLNGKRIREFCEDEDGYVWIGTEDSGLYKFNPKDETFDHQEVSSEFSNVHGLALDGDYLWVGTFVNGLKKINRHTGKVVKTYLNTYADHTFANSAFAVCRTSNGEVFAGAPYGLQRYDKENDDFVELPNAKGYFVYDMAEDAYGNVWFATFGRGVFMYQKSTNKWLYFKHDQNDKTTIPHGRVLSVYVDSRNKVWFTTKAGFCSYDEKTNSFVRYNKPVQDDNYIVYEIQEDDAGLFWLSTNEGLVCFDQENNSFTCYTADDGLLNSPFNYRSSMKDRSGNIYFGTTGGFVKFNPSQFSPNNYVPPIVLTDFALFGEEMQVGGAESPLSESITCTKELRLKHDQHSFSFGVAALGYASSAGYRMRYRLEGFEKQWNDFSGNSVAKYTNVPSGRYVFKVRIMDNDGDWSDDGLDLKVMVTPPFYASIYAYIVYILIITVIIFLLLTHFKHRSIRKQKKLMLQFNQEKERELYTAKIDFFTIIAHEVRTPLTLIKGPLDNIISNKGGLDNEMCEELGIMQKNTDRLLYLTNQLLDFRKIEKDGYRLNFMEYDVIELLRNTYTRFTSLAKVKHINLTFDTQHEECLAHVNRDALSKIFSNLFNNAVKFSETFVSIEFSRVKVRGELCFRVTITNDGELIPTNKREEIFKTFVSLNENVIGTGMGLALSRSFAELHNGTLELLDNTEYNSFELTLPVHQDEVISLGDARPVVSEGKDLMIDEELEQDGAAEINGKKKILVVEDDTELLAFVCKQLKKTYTVYSATNGEEAVRVLEEHEIYLVVTDVQMPKMDGIELCKHIKSTIEISHIPVIMLTAKTNITSKLEGLDAGADVYIEKPFATEFLLGQINNIISNRERWKSTFSNQTFVETQKGMISKTDREFLEKLNEIIQENIANSEFSMEGIAELFCMSRSNFYRKIKAVLNLNPVEYLRIERLKKAAQLIKEDGGRINEICYMVGFNSPSYFAKCFQKQFGISPKEYSKS